MQERFYMTFLYIYCTNIWKVNPFINESDAILPYWNSNRTPWIRLNYGGKRSQIYTFTKLQLPLTIIDI